MNLFNFVNKKKISGMIIPAAVALTFGTMLLTVGYMERVLNKKINLDIRIAKVKARLNAESGVAITIAGPTDNGNFMPSLGSSDWPPFSSDDQSEYDIGIIDTETFSGYYKPENTTSFFPNAGIPNSSDIDMGEFYDIRLQAYANEITRRPERSAVAYGRSKVKNIFGNEIYMTDSAEVRYTVEVLSDFMYLTHHELAGGAPGIFGPTGGDNDERRQPCFGGDDALGSTEQSLVGFVQTLDPMLICSAFPYPTFDNLVYVTKATNNNYTNPPYWVNSEFNTTNVAEGDSILPDFSQCGCDEDDIFLSAEGPDIHPGYEVRDPICFPLQGYKETVLSASAYDTYDSTEMLRLSNQANLNAVLKDTLIMTDIQFLSSGGYRIKRWWYLMPPYLRADVLTCNGQEPTENPTADCNGDGLWDYTYSMPHNLEGMPDVNPYNPDAGDLAQINALCGGPNINNSLVGDITQCDPYEESLHDFSSLRVTSHPQQLFGAIYLPTTYNEVFNTDYQAGFSQMNDGPGGGRTRLSHYDVENFTDYFADKAFAADGASLDWNLELAYNQGGNLIQDEIKTHPEGAEVIIYVKGGPVRVHGTFKGSYTVVTSGWDTAGGNNCLDAGCAGYDGYSTYRRHAWFNSNGAYGGAPIDTIPANIWVTNDLRNADAVGTNGGPPQPDVYDFFGNTICDFESPGDCGGSENIMGLVAAANVVVANSPENRTGGINLHASIAALNESFVMHYWQHGYNTGCAGNPPYDLGDGGSCSQTPPHADNRGRQLYNTEPNNGRGDLRLWGGIIQKYRGYMMRNNPGPYITNDIGMDKDYKFDNNLYFPPPGAIKVTECESNTVRMSMVGYGRPE
jgi:hypothetical protein